MRLRGRAAEDVGSGLAGGFKGAGSGGGGGLGVAWVFALGRGAAAVERVESGQGAFGAEDLLAHAGEVADGLEEGADARGLEPLYDDGDAEVEVFGDLAEGAAGLEEGADDGVFDLRGDGCGGFYAAEAVLVHRLDVYKRQVQVVAP